MTLPKRLDAMSPKESNNSTFWTKLGVAFLNKNESGYTVILDAMPAPVDGAFRFQLFEPKANNSNGGKEASRPTANREIPEDDIPF